LKRKPGSWERARSLNQLVFVRSSISKPRNKSNYFCAFAQSFRVLLTHLTYIPVGNQNEQIQVKSERQNGKLFRPHS